MIPEPSFEFFEGRPLLRICLHALVAQPGAAGNDISESRNIVEINLDLPLAVPARGKVRLQIGRRGRVVSKMIINMIITRCSCHREGACVGNYRLSHI